MFWKETALPLTTVPRYVFPGHLWSISETDGGIVLDLGWKGHLEGQKDLMRTMPEVVKIRLDAQGLREES